MSLVSCSLDLLFSLSYCTLVEVSDSLKSHTTDYYGEFTPHYTPPQTTSLSNALGTVSYKSQTVCCLSILYFKMGVQMQEVHFSQQGQQSAPQSSEAYEQNSEAPKQVPVTPQGTQCRLFGWSLIISLSSLPPRPGGSAVGSNPNLKTLQRREQSRAAQLRR